MRSIFRPSGNLLELAFFSCMGGLAGTGAGCFVMLCIVLTQGIKGIPIYLLPLVGAVGMILALPVALTFRKRQHQRGQA